MPAGVKVVHCPDVRLPEDMQGRGKKRYRDSKERVQSGFVSTKEVREELRGYLGEIKDLTATSFEGLKKKRFKEDKLTKLGAPPAKQQKMPFKMRMGIDKGIQRREKATIAHAKESGVVLASSIMKSKSKGKERERPRRSEDDFDVRTKKGVLHVKRPGSGR